MADDDDGGDVVFCDDCMEIFLSDKNLQQHIRTFHSTEEVEFEFRFIVFYIWNVS